ncbi:MAG: hypothetical protein WC869_08105 [Phycisphaerae bacterium]|jgi:hypothetical protein
MSVWEVVAKVAQPTVAATVAGIPGKQERDYRKFVKSEMERIAGGAGGMSAGQRQTAISEVSGGAAAQERQALARALRGANATGQGSSGLTTSLIGAAGEQRQTAERQGLSDVRGADLQARAADRAAAMGGLVNAMQMAQHRKDVAAGIIAGADVSGSSAQATAQGQGDRLDDAAKLLPLIAAA